MKNFYLVVIVLLLTTIFFNQAEAQVELGLHLPFVAWLDPRGYNQDGTRNDINTPSFGDGIGFQGAVVVSPRGRINLMVDIIGTDQTHSVDNEYINGNHFSGNMDVSAPATLVNAEFNYALVHNFIDKGFNIYGLAGLTLNSYDYAVSYAVSANYNGTTSSSASAITHKNYSSISVDAGLGIEYNLNDKIRFYLDLKYVSGDKISFNQQSEVSGNFMPDVYNPMYIESSLGVRFMLGKRK